MVKQRETDMAMTEDKYDFPFGEHHELRNRHMLVNPSEEWNEQDKHKTSTRQVTTSTYRTSENDMVLKARANFLATYLTPAIQVKINQLILSPLPISSTTAPRLLAFPLPIYRYFCTLNTPSVKIHTNI